VPPAFTTTVPVAAPDTMPGPVHEYDTGVVVVVALACTVLVLQVSVPLADEATAGVTVFWLTDTLPLVTQPLDVLVTV
jgi:hypothetical protein